jgi:hypothetical protein
MRDDGTGLLADGRAVIEMNMDAAREQQHGHAKNFAKIFRFLVISNL